MLNHPVTGLTNASEWRCQELRAEAERFRQAALVAPRATGRPASPEIHARPAWQRLRALLALQRADRLVPLGR
jgi:hypothetical protein